jgi:hypothetical protein
MMQYLPSKKFFIVVLSFAVLAGGTIGYRAWQKQRSAEREKIALQKIATYAQSNASTDSDGDGLLDWEEALFGTNPKRSDTDGDETSDGNEVRNRRDPLAPGPNDYVNAVGTSTTPALFAADDLTETEKIMRTILTFAVRDDGSDKNFPEKLAKSISGGLDKQIQDLPTSYTVKNIKTVIETEASLREYGNGLGGIFKKYDTQEEEQRKLSIALITALKTKEIASFKDFPAMESARKEQISALLKLKVPEEMTLSHIALLNGISNIVTAIENTGYMVSDPARGVIGMKQYESETKKLFATISIITGHFDNSGVVFADTENGSFLYKKSN